ncbi:5-formyltetrahydrofolate cyclo-ligase [Humibacillus xanthopallidus]|uniref:5-formyltetrahydrofolate cyclo-ligase n=1 Tax=Humibacillus xanthopallidus TaxID=412689 RepID=A0A543PYB2_9MICO|nr:5-formyltetrahydrofolate cyclo-ligase [Humibacillus xanthopallidus]TQN49052.1 5-formyltetrahydrofolate cyclo-ligase [Humibacillus xanthopallidus]
MSGPSKRDLRHAARARRARLAAELRARDDGAGVDEAAEAIAATVLGFVPDSGRVAVYESLPDEPPTGRLIERLVESGHEVIVPVVLGDFSLEWRYAVRGTVGGQGTVTRRQGPPDAQERSGWLGVDALARCDLVVTPGLTVDRHGTRLGQGGGCYDRALAHRDPAAPVVTLLHEGEASELDLPADEHDQPVDAYVTTTGRLVRVR